MTVLMPNYSTVCELDASEFDAAVVQRSDFPYIIRGLVKNAPFRDLTLEAIVSLKSKDEVNFKIGWKNDYRNENDCLFLQSDMTAFSEWCCGRPSLFDSFDRSRHWIYADYKNVRQFLSGEHRRELLESVNWAFVGHPEFGAADTTLWIGSEGAYTPCHYDTYGTNFHAVLSGSKRWILYPPADSPFLYPTRLPYEESSVYSSVNFAKPDLDIHQDFPKAVGYMVDVKSGDVLYLPRHWWHFVTTTEASLSFNVWCPTTHMRKEHLKESLVKMLVHAYKCFEGSDAEDWLNPNESMVDFSAALTLVQHSLRETRNADAAIKVDSDRLLDIITSETVMECMADSLMKTL